MKSKRHRIRRARGQRRTQKGGDFSAASSDGTWSEWFANLWNGTKQKAETLVQDAKEGVSTVASTLNSNVTIQPPPPSASSAPSAPAPVVPPSGQPTMGGRRRHRRRHKRTLRRKGGNVASQAQSVTGENLQVVKPNYWMYYGKGGKPV